MYVSLNFGFDMPKKAKKPKKVPKDSWFERLTNDELKSLCKSAKLRLSGTKPELVARLQENEGTARFGVESKPGRWSFKAEDFNPGTVGVTLDELKSECKDAGISSTGTKFKLVERLVQHANGTGAPKRAANVMLNPDGSTAYDENGNAVVKKRKPSTVRPDIDKVEARMMSKIFVDKSKWSNMKWKEHTNAVCAAGEKIITAEVVNKPHFKLRDHIAYGVCIMVLAPISSAWDGPALTGQGRSAYELSELVNTVERLVEDGKPAGDMPALSSEERKREEAFQTSRREADALCETLRAKYKRYVGEELR
jgi:hypothetical protein